MAKIIVDNRKMKMVCDKGIIDLKIKAHGDMDKEITLCEKIQDKIERYLEYYSDKPDEDKREIRRRERKETGRLLMLIRYFGEPRRNVLEKELERTIRISSKELNELGYKILITDKEVIMENNTH